MGKDRDCKLLRDGMDERWLREQAELAVRGGPDKRERLECEKRDRLYRLNLKRRKAKKGGKRK
jgi:hypothetical protein